MTQRDYEKVLDDLKLVSKSIKIVRDENNPDNRRFACGLTEDLVNRIYRDITEMYDVGVGKTPSQSFDGVLKEGNDNA